LVKENEYPKEPAKQSEKALVIRGEPAGMEGARIAALSGYQVIPYQETRRLGGQSVLACASAQFETLINY